MIELLSPVGDFDCLKAAVQNGANAVYFGSNLFSARAFAQNFGKEELEQAINYAKIRGVKTHLTLNTLIKDEEFEEAFNVAKTAYKFGIDAIIVQDIGLALSLIKSFPDLEIHASTQMTTSNLEGAKKLEQLGFKRVVLSRECSLSEIEHICKNTNVDIEVFAHGALCISYSGQCLFSSMVGGRSGNRGRCAQPCRLPYSLIFYNNDLGNRFYLDEKNNNYLRDENFSNKNHQSDEQILDKGYLLSPRDLCSLDNLPKLISAGVASLKIEGRMKSPTYVATVTRIYRKYIDLAYKYLNNEISKYEIDPKDKHDLMQVFNRGEFSAGHLQDEPNKKLIYPQKPNNMGIFLGKIIKFNPNKGLVTAKLENTLSVGDGISFENENTKYTISELMNKNVNFKSAEKGMTVTFGRMKGNIRLNDKIYKLTDKELYTEALNSYSKEAVKTYLSCNLKIHSNEKITAKVKSLNFDIEETFQYDYIPEVAQNAPITKEKIFAQFNKTLNTCFEFSEIDIDMKEYLFIPTSVLNDIRRTAINLIEEKILQSFKRKASCNFDSSSKSIVFEMHSNEEIQQNISYKDYSSKKLQQSPNFENVVSKKSNPQKALLLNILNTEYDYSKLKHFDKIYVPLKYFADKKYENILKILEQKSKIYIYMPVVVKDRFLSTIESMVNKALQYFKISGAVISEMSSISIFKNKSDGKSIAKELDQNIDQNIDNNFELIANYNFNIFNSYSASEVEKLGFSNITLSPELTANELSEINIKNKEVIVYGKIPLMTMSYCLLGKSNRCYKNCKHLCLEDKNFFISDRYNFKFRVVPDNIQTLTTIYNSRNLSFSNVNADCIRFDILDETIDEINKL